jgi:hypothetical protein
MFSKRKALKYGTMFLALGGVALGGVVAYVAAAPDAERARLEDQPRIESGAPIRFHDDVSADAVDSGGIEKDLDGNASAL